MDAHLLQRYRGRHPCAPSLAHESPGLKLISVPSLYRISPVLREEWDALAAAHPDRLKVVYALDKPPKGWTGPTGYISKELFTKNAGAAEAGLAEKVKVFVCGVRSISSLSSLSFGSSFR